MRIALAGIVFAALLLVLSWLWAAPEASHEPSRAEVVETGAARPKPSVAPKQSTRSPARGPLDDRRARRPLEARLEAPVPVESATARARRTLEQRAPARETRVGDLPDRGRAGKDTSKRGHEAFKQRLSWLGETSRAQKIAPRDPIDTSGADLNSDELASIDLDGDDQTQGWEVTALEQLLDRTERHPLKNDTDDAAYPIDLESYPRAWEFEAIDTNGDGWMAESEYYSFLFDTLQDSHLLDTDGDRRVNLRESGLSKDQFEAIDRDESGSLKVWEIRQAVGLGAWERPSPSE